MNDIGRWQVSFDHVGIAVRSSEEARDFFHALFGGTVTWQDRPGARPGGFLAAHIRLGNALVEMIEPNGPNSFLHRYLDRRGPGLHHLTWKAADLDQLVDFLTGRGLRVIDILRRDEKVVDLFIHPQSAFGVLTQFRPFEHRTQESWTNSPSRENLPDPLPERGKISTIRILEPDPTEAAEFFQSIFAGDIEALEPDYGLVHKRLQVTGMDLLFEGPVGAAGPLHQLLEEEGAGLSALVIESNDVDGVAAAAEKLGLTIREVDADTILLDTPNVIGTRMFVRNV